MVSEGQGERFADRGLSVIADAARARRIGRATTTHGLTALREVMAANPQDQSGHYIEVPGAPGVYIHEAAIPDVQTGAGGFTSVLAAAATQRSVFLDQSYWDQHLESQPTMQ